MRIGRKSMLTYWICCDCVQGASLLHIILLERCVMERFLLEGVLCRIMVLAWVVRSQAPGYYKAASGLG